MAGKIDTVLHKHRCKGVSTRQLVCIVAGGLLMVLTGCASTVLKPVSQENRNTTKAFDGDWQVNIKKAAGRQLGPGNWTFNCGGQAGEFPLTVNDSIAQMPFEKKRYDTFVDDAGKFRFEIPLEVEAKATGTSDSSINQSQMTLIVSGSLKVQSGLLVWGVKEFGNNGCKSKLTLVRK